MSAAHKSECPGGAGQVAKQSTNNIVDFTSALDSDKGLATLKARFAIAGHQVHDGSNHDFIVTRWGMARHCPDVAALRIFARVLGVNHG